MLKKNLLSWSNYLLTWQNSSEWILRSVTLLKCRTAVFWRLSLHCFLPFWLNLRLKLHFSELELAIAEFEHIEKRDPFRVDSVDVFSNLLFVTERRVQLANLAAKLMQVAKYTVQTCSVVGKSILNFLSCKKLNFMMSWHCFFFFFFFFYLLLIIWRFIADKFIGSYLCVNEINLSEKIIFIDCFQLLILCTYFHNIPLILLSLKPSSIHNNHISIATDGLHSNFCGI